MQLRYRRLSLLIAQALVLSIGLICLLRLQETKSSYADSKANAAECKQLEVEILQLQQLKSVAGEEIDAGITSKRLMDLLRKINVPEKQVASISPMPAMPIEGTEYERHDVAISLNAVTMEQVMRFLIGVETTYPSAKATSLQLRGSQTSARKPAQSGEVWNVQLTLTQLVYLARTAE